MFHLLYVFSCSTFFFFLEKLVIELTIVSQLVWTKKRIVSFNKLHLLTLLLSIVLQSPNPFLVLPILMSFEDFFLLKMLIFSLSSVSPEGANNSRLMDINSHNSSSALTLVCLIKTHRHANFSFSMSSFCSIYHHHRQFTCLQQLQLRYLCQQIYFIFSFSLCVSVIRVCVHRIFRLMWTLIKLMLRSHYQKTTEF